MNPKNRDSVDELLRRLQASLEDDADADGTPEDVFADRSVSVKKEETDDEIAAFDTYMAQLLGEVTSEEDVRPSRQTKKQEKTAEDDVVAPAYAPDEEAELADEEDAEEASENDAYDSDSDDEHERAAEEETEVSISDDAISAPDARVELPDEEENDEVSTSEKAPVEAFSSEEPEQLAIEEPLSAKREEMPEWNDEKRADVRKAEDIPFEEPTEVSSDRPAYEFSDEPDEPEESEEQDVYDSVSESAADEGDRSKQPMSFEDADREDQTMAPVVLHEGDVLLDAEDEMPPADQSVDAASEKSTTEQNAPSDAAHRPPEQQPQSDAPRPKQSPLDAMAAKAQGNVSAIGGTVAFAKSQKNERTLTDDDVELLLDLGYDSNLTQKVGSRRVETVRYRRQDDERARRALRHVYGCSGEEYSAHTQDKQITATYHAHVKGAMLCVVLSACLAVALLISDMFPLLRDQVPETVAAVTVSRGYYLIGLLLLLLSALVVRTQLWRGWTSLIQFTPIPASIPALLFVITALYDVLALFGLTQDVFLNFPTGIALLLLAVSEWMRAQRESMTFEVVSARSRKIVMEPLSPRKKKVVRGGHIVKIVNDEGGRCAWRVRPTDQLAGYFRRNAEEMPRCRALSVVLAISLTASLLIGVLALIVTGELSAAITAYLLTVQMSLPAAALISYSYPLLHAARILTPVGCAIIGQGAVDEYAGEKTLLFDDTEMFRSKSSTEITIKGSGDTKKYIRYAKRLFATLGGTLRGISTSDLTGETYEERVEILKIYEQGVEARIDGKVMVMAGTSAHMVRHGIRVPGENAELLVRRNVESCILYLAFDGKLRLGYEVDYRISGRFEQMAAELARLGTDVAIETCDPSIHENFLTRSRKVGATPISVVKPVRFERRGDSLLCDSGVVATRSARDIAMTVETCDHLMENDRQLQRFHCLAALAGGVLALALTLFGLLNASTTLVVAGMQLVWCAPVVMLSRKNLINEQRSESEHVI